MAATNATAHNKRLLFKLVSILLSALICVAVLLGIDLYLHYKHGINLHGYRGPSLGAKQPGEKRIAILGGSTTWGFGLRYGQDFPAQLETMLAQSQELSHPAPIHVLNLGFNNEGAYSFKFTMNDYAYLNPDVIVLYSGYNDLNAIQNYSVYRHRSPIFVRTGFLPLLPSLTVDKLTVWKRDLSGSDRRTVFQPPVRGKPVGNNLDEQVGKLREDKVNTRATPSASCPAEWQFYCAEISGTIDLALKQGKRVMVVTEPYISDAHVAQQQALRDMLAARFADKANVRYLDLGWTVDLRDPAMCWDGMHLTAAGNERIAAALREPLIEFLQH